MSKKHRHHHGIRKICRCPRPQRSKCRHPYHFNRRWNGEDFRFSLERKITRLVHVGGRWRRDLTTLGEPITSKAEADAEGNRWRVRIQSGEFRSDRAQASARTLGELCDLYLERNVKVRNPARHLHYVYELNPIRRTMLAHPDGRRHPFGDWRIADINAQTLEQFRQVRSEGLPLAAADRSLQQLRAVYNWAVRSEYVDRTPFKRNGEPVMKFVQYQRRERRLVHREEEKLLAVADRYMSDTIVTTLETAMRRGEIRSLQWTDFEGVSVNELREMLFEPGARFVLPWMKTKTRRTRYIRISERLKPILAGRRFDPSGLPLPQDAYVFGTDIGEQVPNVTFTYRWHVVVLRAYGFKRIFKDGKVDAVCRAALKEINLHFHDLRREAASRWLESGIVMSHVRELLGHTTVLQANTYLASSPQAQHDALRRFDEARGYSTSDSQGPSGTRTPLVKAHMPLRSTVASNRSEVAPENRPAAQLAFPL